MNLKEHLHQFCTTYVEERINRIQSQIKEIQVAFGSETKSSAGDKHETGRAMLQLEREKLGQQLAEAEKTKEVLAKVNIKGKSKGASLGSLVKTSKVNYFLAISAGEYQEGNQLVYCISAVTPIGKLLMGKSEGDTVTFNGEEIKVLEIC